MNNQVLLCFVSGNESRSATGVDNRDDDDDGGGLLVISTMLVSESASERAEGHSIEPSKSDTLVELLCAC
jgi:hypothetical protein